MNNRKNHLIHIPPVRNINEDLYEKRKLQQTIVRGRKYGMIEICPGCQNHGWNKEVIGDKILCSECGMTWKFIKKPFFVLTGCSGVGKTSTGMALQKLTDQFVILDADIFRNVMAFETEEDEYDLIEQIQNLSKEIAQGGRSVLWTMAGNIDKLTKTYSSRFFSEIKVLALVCSEEELRRRMVEGRGITDEGWLNGSISYNEYFRTHTTLEDIRFEMCDITDITPEQAAENVLKWLVKNDL